jgi:hypothetical protein
MTLCQKKAGQARPHKPTRLPQKEKMWLTLVGSGRCDDTAAIELPESQSLNPSHPVVNLFRPWPELPASLTSPRRDQGGTQIQPPKAGGDLIDYLWTSRSLYMNGGICRSLLAN